MFIELEEHFPHLPNAPIVEAVIDFRARATVELEEQVLKEYLENELHGYSYLDSQREYKGELRLGKGQKVAQQTMRDLGWKGVRFQTEENKYIVQFNRNGVVFSRLEPYEDWNLFKKEALRTWRIFDSIAKISEFQRIGLRFINRIKLSSPDSKVEDFFRERIEPPPGLEVSIKNFVYRDTLSVPEHPYTINSIRTIQQPDSSADNLLALILDIDVFTNYPMTMDSNSLKIRLNEMRWLKNKVFFGTLTKEAIDSFE